MSIVDRLRGRRGRKLLRPHEAAVLEALHVDPMDPAAGRPGAAGTPLGSLPPDALTEYRMLAAMRANEPEGPAGLAAPDRVYGIDTELGSLVVVGAVAAGLVAVRVNDGAVFRVSTDGDDERFGSIEAALRSGR